MEKEIIAWGRKISLHVDFDVYENETILPEQIEALDAFVDNPNIFSLSTAAVKEYIEENDKSEVVNEESIMGYIIPRIIYVKRTPGIRTVAIMCDTDVDIEHGIALLFENEEFISIISQEDII